ncbi:hypothetical protein GUITHDRAFT_133220 [Guillardia theta CCMP2712]|uniref:Uncharacterized protein n=1 Tax=Guillardia theta (strain CCMP2712) TaxID=905079 RepID=L1JWU1_GUITC|nr:hypothetical protein GUITHDRAFT_133220 [Guillardia theta CCMP2712]EKX52779.1 hypothetical protein GUITHDRAFT_133220 [Guillardia theta CCMP2712]|eukprot:XP_005839759.1 hypothetical protein GUITHDRAFT_133220 [Guillardia theta CCMP2712]
MTNLQFDEFIDKMNNISYAEDWLFNEPERNILQLFKPEAMIFTMARATTAHDVLSRTLDQIDTEINGYLPEIVVKTFVLFKAAIQRLHTSMKYAIWDIRTIYNKLISYYVHSENLPSHQLMNPFYGDTTKDETDLKDDFSRAYMLFRQQQLNRIKAGTHSDRYTIDDDGTGNVDFLREAIAAIVAGRLSTIDSINHILLPTIRREVTTKLDDKKKTIQYYYGSLFLMFLKSKNIRRAIDRMKDTIDIEEGYTFSMNELIMPDIDPLPGVLNTEKTLMELVGKTNDRIRLARNRILNEKLIILRDFQINETLPALLQMSEIYNKVMDSIATLYGFSGAATMYHIIKSVYHEFAVNGNKMSVENDKRVNDMLRSYTLSIRHVKEKEENIGKAIHALLSAVEGMIERVKIQNKPNESAKQAKAMRHVIDTIKNRTNHANPIVSARFQLGLEDPDGIFLGKLKSTSDATRPRRARGNNSARARYRLLVSIRSQIIRLNNTFKSIKEELYHISMKGCEAKELRV